MGSFSADFRFRAKVKKATSRADLKILQLELWLEPARLGLITTRYILRIRAVASVGAGGALQFLAKQLTLSQPGGQIMPITVLQATPHPLRIFRPYDGPESCDYMGIPYKNRDKTNFRWRNRASQGVSINNFWKDLVKLFDFPLEFLNNSNAINKILARKLKNKTDEMQKK